MKNILFLCTGNSCRSQMAEGWARHLKGDVFHFHSAGTKSHGLNPLAVRVMNEVGVDISKHESKTLDDVKDIKMDFVFTVCSDAHESCPVFPHGKTIHVGFDDPPRLTVDCRTDNEKLPIYRRVRDEIRDFVMNIEKYIES